MSAETKDPGTAENASFDEVAGKNQLMITNRSEKKKRATTG